MLISCSCLSLEASLWQNLATNPVWSGTVIPPDHLSWDYPYNKYVYCDRNVKGKNVIVNKIRFNGNVCICEMKIKIFLYFRLQTNKPSFHPKQKSYKNSWDKQIFKQIENPFSDVTCTLHNHIYSTWECV